jgi:dCMP deaminase
MGISLLSSMRSKDPNTQVGACIVNDENKIMSVGYNGFPRGCSDDDFPWERSAENPNDTKYPFVCHAELNAILNAGGRDLNNSRIFVALFPCNECAKAIIQSGIKEVVYISDKYASTDATKASKRMLESAGVKLTKFTSDKNINISFSEGEV